MKRTAIVSVVSFLMAGVVTLLAPAASAATAGLHVNDAAGDATHFINNPLPVRNQPFLDILAVDVRIAGDRLDFVTTLAATPTAQQLARPESGYTIDVKVAPLPYDPVNESGGFYAGELNSQVFSGRPRLVYGYEGTNQGDVALVVDGTLTVDEAAHTLTASYPLSVVNSYLSRYETGALRPGSEGQLYYASGQGYVEQSTLLGTRRGAAGDDVHNSAIGTF